MVFRRLPDLDWVYPLWLRGSNVAYPQAPKSNMLCRENTTFTNLGLVDTLSVRRVGQDCLKSTGDVAPGRLAVHMHCRAVTVQLVPYDARPVPNP